MIHDFCVIGGGIVGLATAMELLAARPGASVVVLEKEDGVARHQTGRNSGVIHAGIYYQPGSLKAELCRKGQAATKAFCAEHAIKFEVCGKLLVATNELEASRMDALQERAGRNGIEVERLDGAELRRREPSIVGVGALFAKSTGIVDYAQVSAAMRRVIELAHGKIELGTAVTAIEESGNRVEVRAGERRWEARKLIVCGGLQSDRLAKMAGLAVDFHVVPFRGEYFKLAGGHNSIVKSLIYPIPDPTLPFLGIHLTRMIDGSVTVGPNAVLGLAREGYGKFAFDARDVADYAGFAGFWRLIWQHRASAWNELKNSLSRKVYLAECRKYCPELNLEDLLPYRTGIRAQAVRNTGEMIHDFVFIESPRMLHVCNAPSPAATSSIPIAKMIVEKCLKVAA